MHLIVNWRRVLGKAWSVRLMAAATALSTVEAALPQFSSFVPPKTFAVVSAVVSATALVARLVAQPSLRP